MLEIHIDDLLTFEYHTKYLCTKGDKFCINKSKNFLTPPLLITIYHSLVYSHFAYCTPIIGCTSTTNILTISKVQKKAIRLTTKINYLAHTEPIFTELKILPLPKFITFTQPKLMHFIVRKHSPYCLHNIFQLNNQCDINHDPQNANDYSTPFPRIKLFKKHFLSTSQLNGII
jgi:hypothetical protein